MTAAVQGTPLVVALSGGIGGAKLALGLSRVLAPGRLTAAVNTGDDFVHLGLAISPDLDTLLYTLAGLSDPERGWGRRDETWTFMAALAALGGETWFNLGDGDLALNVERSRRLAAGESLAAITGAFCRALGVSTRILPMSGDPVRTRVLTDDGWIDFQDYFVRRRCAPRVRDVVYEGAGTARVQPELLEALRHPDLEAVVICPSNPILSIGPMLAMPALRQALADCAAPVVAVSPIIAGQAVKGPTAKMMAELGVRPGAAEVARYYDGLLDAYIVDISDAGADMPAGVRVVAERILMQSLDDRDELARAVLRVADDVRLQRGDAAARRMP